MDGKEADDDGLFSLPSGVRTDGPACQEYSKKILIVDVRLG